MNKSNNPFNGKTPEFVGAYDKLLNHFKVFDVDELMVDNIGLEGYDENASFEERLFTVLTSDSQDWYIDTNGVGWGRKAFYNGESGHFSDVFPKFQDYVFSVSSLKKRFRGKWFNQHKHYLSERLRKLYDEDVLIKLGKNMNRENVYALNNNNGSKISEKLPSFDDKSMVTKFKEDSFNLVFPKCSGAWDKFIEIDSPDPVEKSITESVKALYQLPFIREVNDV